MRLKYPRMLAIFLVLVITREVVGANILTARFIDSFVCKSFQYLEDSGHLETTSNVSSSIECSALCGRNDTCLGSIMTNQSKCYLLKYSHDIMNITDPYCDKDSESVSIKKSACEKGVLASKLTDWPKACRTCKGGWVSPVCRRLAASCLELMQAGYSPSGWTKFHLQTGSTISPVPCYLGVNIKVELFASQGKLDQSLSWQEYVNGYYFDENHHFVGLEALHALTSLKHQYIVNKFLLKNASAEKGQQTSGYFVNYYNLIVRNASNGYSLDYDSLYIDTRSIVFLENNVTDCLSGSRGVPFSTWDHDVDGDKSRNCAAIAKAGWWFDRCDPIESYCNPLGRTSHYLPQDATTGYVAFPGINLVERPYSSLEFQAKLVLFRN